MFNTMFKQPSIKINRFVCAGTALLALAPAWAVAGPQPARYDNELARCMANLRGEIMTPALRRIRYLVTDIERQGAWYRFEIRSELSEDSDGPVSSVVESHCRAHRFSDVTELEI